MILNIKYLKGFINTYFALFIITGPDDWWATIITTVSLAIDNNAKKDEVRKFFVTHEGKKTLSVKVL